MYCIRGRGDDGERDIEGLVFNERPAALLVIPAQETPITLSCNTSGKEGEDGFLNGETKSGTVGS